MVIGDSKPEAESLKLAQEIDLDRKFVRVIRNNESGALKEVLLDPNFEPPQVIINQALRFACGRGYVEILGDLCEGNGKKAEINSKDEKGRSATYIAARMGQVECLRKLLQLGADVNLATAEKKRQSSKESAVAQLIHLIRSSRGHLDGILSFQLPLDERGCMTPLHAAVRYNSPECVCLILEHNGDVHAKDELGMQPILHAGTWVKSGDKAEIRKYEKVLGHLLHYGANANASYIDDSDDIPISMSPLQTAAGLGSTVAVKELLEKGAEPRWGEGVGSGRTALHEAAKGRHFWVLQLLLPNAKEENEEEQKRRKEWVNLKDDSGNTALHYAAISGSKPCLTLLLEKGGNHGAKNRRQWQKHGIAEVEPILIHRSDAKHRRTSSFAKIWTQRSRALVPVKPNE